MRENSQAFVRAVCAVGLGAWVIGHAAAARATGPGCPAGASGDWVGFAPARSGDRVVAWTEHQIVVGDGSAAGWRVIHDDAADEVAEAAIAADGTVWALRTSQPTGMRLWRIAPGSAPAAVPLPQHGWLRGLAIGGGTVAASGDPGLLVASVPGSTFRGVDVSLAYAGELGVRGDGSVDLLEVEVNTCGSSDRLEWVRRHRVTRSGAVQSAEFPSAQGLATSVFSAGAYGWVYGDDWTDLWALTPHKARRVTGWRRSTAADTGETQIAASETRTLALLGPDLVELRGARARVLDRSAPPELASLAVDSRGRALGIAGGTIWRWAGRTGWERMLPACR